MHLQFFGAAGEVTGSCYLLTVGACRILVDCGLFQGSRKDEARNRQPFPFNPASIDAVILTHSHLDHSGRIPLLIKNGFAGQVHTHRASRDLCRIMLRDAAYINEKEADWSNRKRLRKGLEPIQPLYSVTEARDAMRRFSTLEYGQKRVIAPGIVCRLRDAGHILGSSLVELWLEERGVRRKLVFSGDLGHQDAPILRDPERIARADLVILESTYGDRLHRSWSSTWQEMAEVIAEASAGGGNVLVPSFAVGRTQDVLYAFRQHYAEWNIGHWRLFLDSPLAIEATEIYTQHTDLYDVQAREVQAKYGNPFLLPNLTLSRTANQSMAINRLSGGAMVIAGSGMCDGGRIKHHLKHNIWRRNCHVIIVGFQVAGTTGRALVDGATYIRLWGETIKVQAKIHTIGGLSAHADQAGLTAWYKGFEQNPPLVLAHGEPAPREVLRGVMEQRLGSRVMTPVYGDVIDLTRLHLVAQPYV